MRIKISHITFILYIIATQTNAQTYNLFTFYNDGNQTMAWEAEPYFLLRNGKPAGSGITNKKGEIFTSLHKKGLREDWIIKFVTNEVGLSIYPNGTTKVVSLYNNTSNWQQNIYGKGYFSAGAEQL